MESYNLGLIQPLRNLNFIPRAISTERTKQESDFTRYLISKMVQEVVARDHGGLNQYNGSGSGENSMEWREMQKMKLLRLGDYLDIENEKEKEVKHEVLVSGPGNLVDGKEIEKLINSGWEDYE